jgi:hypothetical protein
VSPKKVVVAGRVSDESDWAEEEAEGDEACLEAG